MAYDLIVKDALVVDGSGMPGYSADVGVKGGRIAEIGRIKETAARIINARGQTLAPGFIDQHTHMDAHLLWDAAALPLPEHGVTTLVTGNCGLSLMPARPGDEGALMGTFVRVEAIPRSLLESLEWRWSSTAEYLAALEERPGVNVASMVGHNAIRQYVMGEDATEREATAEEIESMRELMRQAMREGAIGWSINRNPSHYREDGKPLPSRVASEEELLGVASVLSEFSTGMIQQSSMRASDMSEMEWAARLGEASRRPVIWSGVNYRKDKPDFHRQQLRNVEGYFQKGLRLYGNTNIVPFVNRFALRNGQFFDTLPSWRALPEGGRAKAASDPNFRATMRQEMSPDLATRLAALKVLQSKRPENKDLEGKTVGEVARLRKADPLDAILDLSLEEGLETMFLSGNPIDDEMGEIVRSPYTIVGQSDAGAHVQFLSNFGVCTSLLGQYVRERGLVGLEEAVKEVTFKVASVFGIRDRGLIWPGWAADLVLFDPETIESKDLEEADDYPGGFRRVLQHARGVSHTIVNGEILIENGAHTGAYPGRVIRNSYASALS